MWRERDGGAGAGFPRLRHRFPPSGPWKRRLTRRPLLPQRVQAAHRNTVICTCFHASGITLFYFSSLVLTPASFTVLRFQAIPSIISVSWNTEAKQRFFNLRTQIKSSKGDQALTTCCVVCYLLANGFPLLLNAAPSSRCY